MSLSRICVSLGWMLLLLGALGCGSSTPPSVNGTVNYNGIPVTGGIITFHFGGGKNQAFGSIDGSGKYVVSNAVTGPAKVTINTESIKNSGGPSLMAKMGAAKDAVPGAGEVVTMSYMKIPAKYADSEKTDLSYEVKSGPQVKNFDLND